MIRLFSYSLSLRLLAIFLLLAVLFAWGVVSGIRWAYSADDLRSLISGHLSLHVDYVRKDIGSPPNIEHAIEITRKVPVDIRISGPGVSWSSDTNFPTLNTLDFGPSSYFSSDPDSLVGELKGVDYASWNNHRLLRFSEGDYQIIVMTPKVGQQSNRPPLIPILVGFALFLVLCAYLAVRALFKPIATIREGAAYIGAGHFTHRINTHRHDELSELASDINSMANKVEGMLDAKRELLLAVSHELRSPISRMKLGLALLDDSKEAQSLKQDVEEMRVIVDTLLEAERLGGRHAALNRSNVSLNELMQGLRERYFTNESRLRIEINGNDQANIDPARIELMLKNLIGNALRYSQPEDGSVEVTINHSDKQLEFRVRDYGPGIPEDQREHIGEPFYRSDASRNRDTGGTGLGLYLARQVARAHGGDLVLQDTDGKGALFVVSISTGQQ